MVQWNFFGSSIEVLTINELHQKPDICSAFNVHLHTQHNSPSLQKKMNPHEAAKKDYITSPLFVSDPVNHSILKQYQFCRGSSGETTVVRRYATGLFSSRPHLHIRLI